MKPTKGREFLLRQLTNLMIREGWLQEDNQALTNNIDTMTALNRLQSQITSGDGINDRLNQLETKYLYYEVYELIEANTGAITKAEESTILLNRYRDAGDAIVVKIDTNNRPIDEAVETDLGEVVVVTSFDTLGNYVLSGIPSGYPVALVYQIKIQLKYINNVVESSIVNYIIEDVAASSVTVTQTPIANSDKVALNDSLQDVVGKVLELQDERVKFGRTIETETATLALTDNYKIVNVDFATAITITIPEGTFSKGDWGNIQQIGAGEVVMAVANATNQFINPEFKTAGQYKWISWLCEDDTEDAEVFKIIGGI